MPTYATTEQVTEYVEGGSGVELPAALDALIERAERDVDRIVGARAVDDATGLKFVPATLTTGERDDLMRATAAQVEYRASMGEDFFVREQFERVTGPEFSTEGTLPRIGPKVWEELAGSGLLKLTTSWGGSGSSPPWASFAYNVGDDDADDPPPL